jgi:DNA-directed RNA polymerase specialized sigma24 family protein
VASLNESGDALLCLATLLTCDDLGEDVYQETLHRLAARRQNAHVQNPRAFRRRVMHNIVIDQARTQGSPGPLYRQTPGEFVLEQATNLLWEPDLSPQLRSRPTPTTAEPPRRSGLRPASRRTQSRRCYAREPVSG